MYCTAYCSRKAVNKSHVPSRFCGCVITNEYNAYCVLFTYAFELCMMPESVDAGLPKYTASLTFCKYLIGPWSFKSAREFCKLAV